MVTTAFIARRATKNPKFETKFRNASLALVIIRLFYRALAETEEVFRSPVAPSRSPSGGGHRPPFRP